MKGAVGLLALAFAFTSVLAVAAIVLGPGSDTPHPDPEAPRDLEPTSGAPPLTGIGRSLQYFTARHLLLQDDAPTEENGCFTWTYPGFMVKMAGPDANLSAIMVTVPAKNDDSMMALEMKLTVPASIVSMATGGSISPNELLNWIEQGGGDRVYGDLLVRAGAERNPEGLTVVFLVVHKDTDVDAFLE